MNFDSINIAELIEQLDDRRQALNMSYQNVADVCDVSQKTIMRFFKHESDPSLTLVKNVVAALQYETASAPVPPGDPAKDDYIKYLRELVDFERKDKRIRLDWQEARLNRLRNENRRVIVVLGGIVLILVVFICGVFAYDIANPDIGWFREYMEARTMAESVLIAIRDWWNNLWERGGTL